MNILACINRVAAQKFTPEDIYRYERELQAKHPQNHHIRPKIRQQLQFLRDLGYITFMGPGNIKLYDKKKNAIFSSKVRFIGHIML